MVAVHVGKFGTLSGCLCGNDSHITVGIYPDCDQTKPAISAQTQLLPTGPITISQHSTS